MAPGTKVEKDESSKNTAFANTISSLSGTLSAGNMSGIKASHAGLLRTKHRKAKNKYRSVKELANKAAHAADDIREGDVESGERIQNA